MFTAKITVENVFLVARGIPYARVEFIPFFHWASLAVLQVALEFGSPEETRTLVKG